MKFTTTKINDRLTVLTSDKRVRKGTVVLDPVNKVNRIEEIYNDGSVRLKDNCGAELRSVERIEAVIIDGIRINLK